MDSGRTDSVLLLGLIRCLRLTLSGLLDGGCGVVDGRVLKLCSRNTY